MFIIICISIAPQKNPLQMSALLSQNTSWIIHYMNAVVEITHFC
jgi:hypothetical protein